MPCQIVATWIRSCLSTSLFEIFRTSCPWLAGRNAYPVACRVFGLWPALSNASSHMCFKSLEQIPKSCAFYVLIARRKHQIIWYLLLFLSVTELCSEFSILLLKLIFRLKWKKSLECFSNSFMRVLSVFWWLFPLFSFFHPSLLTPPIAKPYQFSS